MMRALLMLTVPVVLALGGCNGPACPSANAASPTHVARFAASASTGSVSQILLLEVTGSGTAATVARITDYTSDGSALTGQSWLDTRTRWPGMRGRGLGQAPYLTPAVPLGEVVVISTETSVVQLPLHASSAATDAGTSGADAGAYAPPYVWEWIPPEVEVPQGTIPPGIADVVASGADGVALVARSAVGAGGTLIGGELFVLDVSSPSSVVPLASALDFRSEAEAGLFVAPAGFAVMDGLVFVALDHQTFDPLAPVYGTGLVAVIDPAVRSVRTVLRLPALRGCADIGHYHRVDPADPVGDHRLVVTCRGSVPETAGAPPVDGGFAYIEYDPTHPQTAPTLARTITSASLGIPRADGGTATLYGHWVAFVARGVLEPRFQERVIAVDLDTGAQQVLASTLPANGTSTTGFGPGAFDPVSGVLVVPNGYDGVYTWAMPSDPTVIEPAGSSYTFADPQAVAVTGCGHLPVRQVRLIPSTGTTTTPPRDAGTPANDAASAEDGAVIDVDAGP